MPEEMIFCPSCNRKVRIPTEMLGTAVKCPLCGVVFTAPLPPGELPGAIEPAPMGPPGDYADVSGRPLTPYLHPWASPEERRSAVRGRVLAAAIALFFIGGLALLDQLVRVVLLVADPDAPARMARAVNQALGQQQEMPKETLGGIMIASIIFFSVISIIIMVGAFQMMRFRTWGFAVASSILPWFIISDCCCALGLPIGIWALIILLMPNVKGAFQ